MKLRLFPRGKKELRNAAIRLGIALVVILIVPFVALWWFTSMPGESHSGKVPPPAGQEMTVRKGVEKHVRYLAETVGERNPTVPEALKKAAEYIAGELRRSGYEVSFQAYQVEGVEVKNIEAVLSGGELADEIIVLGAHYDTAWDTPGADDNASGIAGLLEAARLLRGKKLARTVRFVAFTLEEPPYFHTENMGSLRYARRCAERDENVVAAVVLEMLGYYDDEKGSQAFPPGLSAFYPDTGNFVAFVGNLGSRSLLHESIEVFRETTALPSEGLAGPAFINGVDFSDHWSFWQEGYDAIMVTDTAFFRNHNYHEATDTPDTLDFDRLARVAAGVAVVLETLANE